MNKQVDRRDLQKELHWLEIIRRQKQSGESVRAFCRREGLTESALYWWRRELTGRREKNAVDRDHSMTARFPAAIDAQAKSVEVTSEELSLLLWDIDPASVKRQNRYRRVVA